MNSRPRRTGGFVRRKSRWRPLVACPVLQHAQSAAVQEDVNDRDVPLQALEEDPCDPRRGARAADGWAWCHSCSANRAWRKLLFGQGLKRRWKQVDRRSAL